MARQKSYQRRSKLIKAYLTKHAHQRAIIVSRYLGLDVSIMIRKVLLQPGFLFLDAAALISVLGDIAAQFSRMLLLLEQILDESAQLGINERSLDTIKQLQAGYERVVVNFEQLSRIALERLDDKHPIVNTIYEL